MPIHALNVLPQDLKQWIVFTPQPTESFSLDSSLDAAIREAVDAGQFTGASEEIVPVMREGKTAVLVGLGESPETLSQRKWGMLSKQALLTKPLSANAPVGILLMWEYEAALRGVVDGASLGLYNWDKYLSEKKPLAPSAITIATQSVELIERFAKIAEGVNFARDLANENADIANAEYLAQSMIDLANQDVRCEVEVLGRAELEAKGLHLHLAVNRGSDKEPRLVIVKYQGASKDLPFTALVGKGITFDSGGLNLKPSGGIESMRMDMSGAAAVIGTLRNAIALGVERNLYFVCGFAENAIGPGAYKPGDVVSSYAGKSVEIGNTDAEGRLVLADALAYMARNHKPEILIDIATLTGAVIMALGYEYSGLMSTDRALADALLKAARLTDDRAWELPLYPELGEHVKSQIADIRNTGLPRVAGTISAGEFLRQFAQFENANQKWAHLDIAGTAKPKNELAYFGAGATGAGVRLLTEYILQ